MAQTPHDGQGTKLTWKASTDGGTGVVYTVTNIVYSLGEQNQDNAIDISHLGQTVGQSVLTMDRPLVGNAQAGTTGRNVTIDYQGSSIFVDGVSGTLTITIGGAAWLANVATVQSSSVTLATNDIIRGNANFRIAR